MDNRPIGVLDSGLGGLTVLKKVIEKLPDESTVFIGDQANMPYGDRTKEEIIELTRASVKFLMSKNVKTIIFGCNTATAAAMPTIQKEIPIQIIGVIQSGALAASKETKNKKVAVLGTNATVESHAYAKELKFRNPEIKVKEYAQPLWAPMVEENPSEQKKLAIVKSGIDEIQDKDFDTLVLGCTHYPLLRNEIEASLNNSKVQILDPADQVAQYTHNVLKRDNLLGEGPAKHEYFTTANVRKFNEIAREWMQDPTINAKHVND